MEPELRQPRIIGDARPQGERKPSAEALLDLTAAGAIRLDTTLGDAMRKIGGIERDLGTASLTYVFDTDKYLYIMK